MKPVYFIFLISSLLFCSCRKHAPIQLNESDRNFLAMASHFNRSQIEVSNLCRTKAADEGVKRLAEQLVTYHLRSQNHIDRFASENNSTISSRYNQKHRNMRNSLSQLSGKTFDSVYVCYQLKLHLTMLNLINDEIYYGKNQDLKNYASRINADVLWHLNQSDSLSQLFLSTYFLKDI